MSVIMHFGGRKAILNGAQWRAADSELERILNAATREWLRETGGPALGDVDPDFTTALTIGVSHGGRIHRHLPSDRAGTRGAYVRARQLPLF